MICPDVQERLSAYLDGALSPMEMEEVSEHVRGCEACRIILSELRQVRDELRSLPEVPIPDGLHSSIMRSLEPHLKPKRRPLLNLDFRGWGYRQWVPVTAAMMVLVMFVSVGGTIMYSARMAQRSELQGARADDYATSNQANTKVTGPVSKVRESAADNAKGGAAGPEQPAKSLAGQPGLLMGAPSDGGAKATGAGSERLLDTARKIIRRAQLVLEVSRSGVKPASAEAVRIVQANFGYVETSSTTESDSGRKEITSFFMVARVPADSLDKVVQDLTGLGRTVREDASAEDVTDSYVDLSARLRNKENQESRLLQIMGQAKTVGELLQVEGELSRVRGDIESMRAQKLNYDKAVDLSTITLTIAEEGSARPRPSPWSEVWRVFVDAWRRMAVFLARIAPAVIVVAALVLGAVWTARRKKSLRSG